MQSRVHWDVAFWEMTLLRLFFSPLTLWQKKDSSNYVLSSLGYTKQARKNHNTNK